MKTTIVVIDILNDFVTGVFRNERAEKIIPTIKQLLNFARDNGVPVIYVNDAHLPNVDVEFDVWPPHALAGTWGAQVVDELKPEKGDFVLEKRKYSAFQGTGLDQLLRELEVDTLIITGLVTDICIQHTAADAFFKGYKIVVPEDCVEAINARRQKAALDYLKKAYGCKITRAGEIMRTKWS
ncbi:MAG: cysteine hydrolase [Candidatus Bathyarchaeota archaeon]|nr:MAG: cysteine hydrolase [Candidatus Bathyarchaeota archaeon]UCD39813.1 MAG: cysteine hydrolase [Candidatus Bathyarchaeota archaeon]